MQVPPVPEIPEPNCDCAQHTPVIGSATVPPVQAADAVGADSMVAALELAIRLTGG